MDGLFIFGIWGIIIKALPLFPARRWAYALVLIGAITILMTPRYGFAFPGLQNQLESVDPARSFPQALFLFVIITLPAEALALNSIFKNRQRKEKNSHQSEMQFRTLFETLPIGISITDKDGNIIEVNHVSEKLLGISATEHTQRNLNSPSWNIIRPDGSPMPAEQLPATVALKQNRLVENVEMGVYREDRSLVWLNVTATPLPWERRGTLIAYMDITPLKKAQEELRKSKEQNEDLFEHSKNLICSQDLTGKLISMNPESSRVLGYEAKELVGMRMQDLMPPELRDTVDPFLEEIQRQGVVKGIVTVLSRLGERRLWEYTGLLKSSGTEEPIIHGFARDITEQWQAQKALKKSEEKYRTLAETAQDYILSLDLSGKPIYINPAALAVSGYCLEEAFQLNISDILPREYIPQVEEMLASRINGDDTHRVYEMEFITKQGKRIPVEINSTVIKDNNKTSGVLVIARDLTFRKESEEQRRKMEDQLRHVQKLESLGVLAGGIAHDFNNLLMGILGNADLALMDLSPASLVRQNILEIEKASRRAAELCRQMLAYSGKGKFVIEKLNLSEVVQEMTNMLEVTISKKVTLRYHFDSNLPAVKADATQLRQVIMNLITNASEAIGEANGMITVSTGAMECDSQYLNEIFVDYDLSEGPYVYLEVSDTGCGMDEATQKKIFDPFFTTKFTGRGLGLAATLGIIRGHQGAIKVYSEPGKGSTLKVLFPALPLEQEEPGKNVPEAQETWNLVGR